jgi:hypothetical protein
MPMRDPTVPIDNDDEPTHVFHNRKEWRINVKRHRDGDLPMISVVELIITNHLEF